MGIQIHSSIEYRMAVEIIQGGAIGKVKEVHSWSDRPGGIWSQGAKRRQGQDPVPAGLNWDLWLGVAPERPYLNDYVPARWRGVLDFGCGALGDMGCHIIDPPYTALKLGSPKVVWTEGPGCTDDQFPLWEIIHYEFPATEYTVGPTVPVTWYDGGKQPSPSLLPLEGRGLPGNGSIFIGEKGSILLPHIGGPQLFPKEQFAGFKRPKLEGRNHYVQWVKACLGQDKASANFDFAGPLTEMVLLGVLSARFAGKKLEWDAANLKVTNLDEANQFVRTTYRKGWEVEGL
jgi:hypothetical protein